MEQNVLIFGKDCVIKNAFQKNKTPISIDEVNIIRIVLSNEHSFGNKGYNMIAMIMVLYHYT